MPQSRSVTMKDVAREAGVSKALVSMAFRNVDGVNEQTRIRILETAKRMGYRVNRIASQLASQQTNTFGVFLLDLRQDVYADMLDGIRLITDTIEQHLVLTVGMNDGSRDRASLESLIQSRVDVIIANGLLMPDAEVQLINQSTPVVSVARLIPGVDSVSTNNIGGAQVATEHLLSLGHRRILFLSNPLTDGYHGRHKGYLDSMRHAGCTPWIVDSHYSRQQAKSDIWPILTLPANERPTAIFAHNDTAALGVLDALVELGMKAPEDISLIGYDNSLLSQAPGTDLTTVDIHGQELGMEAARMAIARLKDLGAPPRDTSIEPTLVIRKTTGPVPVNP